MGDYWQKRQESTYKAGEMKVNQYFAKLEKAFNQTKRELQKTVEAFYFRYAEENGLTFAAAQQRLDKAEVGELRDFIALAMENIGKYNQDVNNMSIKARITRYQALEAQVDALLRQLYAIDYEAEAEKTMQEIYEDSYYRTWYNIDQYRGFHSAFAQVDPLAVEQLLEYPFNGANFSSRLWKQKDHLQTVLMESLTTMMVQGVPPQNLAADFAKKMQSKKFEAYRLLHTESSFLMSEAAHAGYKEDDVEKYEIIATLDSKTCGICGELDGKVYPVEEAVTGKNMPPFHCFCRCTDAPHYDDTDMTDMTRAARDADGNPIEVPADMTYKEWKKKFIESTPQEYIRTPVDIEFDTTIVGCKNIEGGYSVRSNGQKYGQESYIVTLNKRNTTEWDELPFDIRNQLQYSSMENKSFHLAKGDYEVQRYVEGSTDCIERDEIAKEIGAEYIGFAFQRKNNQPFYIDFYKKDDELLYSIGKADAKKRIKDDSLEMVEKIAMEREKQIIKNIGEANLKNISLRSGDEWVSAMKEFHRSVQADGKPTILPDSEYKAVQSPTLYRGIAPQSRLRSDITTSSTTKEMADEFFKGDSPFPSRGVYGDGIAYAAPSYKRIAWNYATNGGKQLHGGVIIEFKLRTDARVITYEDAINVFKKMSSKGGSKLLFNQNQQKAFDKEVGKAMNALGYDAIIKHNGDNTGIDFYVILNRAALVTKKKYITTVL